MKVYQTNEIKNISLLGSKGSGKTTLAEACLLYTSGEFNPLIKANAYASFY